MTSRRDVVWVVLPALVLSLTGCAARSRGPRSPVADAGGTLEVREGLAPYYGPGLNGRTTASGARFDATAMVAAHPTYPFGTRVRVTNLTNGRSVELRILDRGPSRRVRADGIIIDVSQGVAQALGFVKAGRTRVRVEVLRWGT